MPVKNPSALLRAGIIPGQTVTKEKLQRARPLCPSDISPFSKCENGEKAARDDSCREDCGASGRNYAGTSWESILGGSKLSRDRVVDYYCHRARLVVEVDGDVHDLQQEEDAPLCPTDIPPFSQVKFRR